MRTTLTKSAIAAIAALALGGGVAVSTAAPAAAAPQVWQHGGNWGHGGWGRGGWDHDHGGWGRGGWGWGPAVGLGIVGGLVAGAAIANSGPYYGPGPYGDSCWQPRPMYDAWGRYIGSRTVNVCY